MRTPGRRGTANIVKVSIEASVTCQEQSETESRLSASPVYLPKRVRTDKRGRCRPEGPTFRPDVLNDPFFYV